jgi:thiol-disulfide isomerase/thioredoxin
MKKVIGLAVIIIALIAIFSIGGDSEDLGNSAVVESDNDKLSLFELEDYEGQTYKLKDFKGKLLVINSWASWCPFCVNELPELSKLQSNFPDDISVIAVNRAEPNSIAKDFLDNLEDVQGITFLADSEDSFFKSIGGFSMPETVFVNGKGEILEHKRSPLKFDEMKDTVEKLLEK